jgi:hypothetical protein
MTVETASYISQLSSTYPTSTDNISEGDDHIRLIKTVLKTQFPNIGASAVNPTASQFNKLGFEPGTVVMWASVTTPTTQTISGINDWLLCDGTSYNTTTYATLYGVIGTTFGGAGSNFNVPDFRTYFPVGVGSAFVLGTAGSASAASGSAVLKYQPINFIIKT